MTQIPLGARHETKVVVTREQAIDFMGLDGARVLSTPRLILELEMASHNAIQPHLEAGFDSVGTHVDVKHLAATPIGMSVTVIAEVISVENRRVRCRVEAFDEREKIAEGTHERFVVNAARFADRVQAKFGSGK